MITGLDKFAAHFSGYRDRYLLIGGAAVWPIMDEAGIDPRATRDLDMALCLEAHQRRDFQLFCYYAG